MCNLWVCVFGTASGINLYLLLYLCVLSASNMYCSYPLTCLIRFHLVLSFMYIQNCKITYNKHVLLKILFVKWVDKPSAESMAWQNLLIIHILYLLISSFRNYGRMSYALYSFTHTCNGNRNLKLICIWTF